MIHPLKNNILFVFLDKTSGKFFEEETDWGFQIKGSPDESAKNARWGFVLATGPDVIEEIQNRTFVLIEPLQWTDGFEYDGQQIWQTDDTKIMVYSTESPKLI